MNYEDYDPTYSPPQIMYEPGEEFSTPESAANTDDVDDPPRRREVERNAILQSTHTSSYHTDRKVMHQDEREYRRKQAIEARTKSRHTRPRTNHVDADRAPPKISTTSTIPPTMPHTMPPPAPIPNTTPPTLHLEIKDVEDMAGDIKWLSQITAEKIADLKQLYRKLIRSERAVEETKDHLEKKSAPKHLNIRITAKVTKEHQETVDNAVNNAVWVCQESILHAVLDARRSELNQISADIRATMQSWITDKDNYAALMIDAGVPVPPMKVAQAELGFHKNAKEALYNARMNSVIKIKRKEEKLEATRSRANERAIDELLDPETARLQTRLNKLEKKLSGLQKNRDAKPVPTKKGNNTNNTGGGKPSNTQKPSNKITKSNSRSKSPGHTTQPRPTKTTQDRRNNAGPRKGGGQDNNRDAGKTGRPPRNPGRGRGRGRGRDRGRGRHARQQ